MQEIVIWMISNGYNQFDIKKILTHYSIGRTTTDVLFIKIKTIFEYLSKLGYSKEETIKLTKKVPSIFGYSIESLNKKIDDLIELGFNKNLVINMIKKQPVLLTISIESIKKLIDEMVLLGYSKQSVLEMAKMFPGLFECFIESIKEKIENIILLGYTKEEVLRLTENIPVIFGLNKDNLTKKIEYLQSIGLKNIVIKYSTCIIQSLELTYARYEYFYNRGVIIDENGYSKLFISAKRFELFYGISKSDLLEMYNYERDFKQGQIKR